MFSIFNHRYVRLIVIGLGGFILGAAALFLYFHYDSPQPAQSQEENNWFYILDEEEENEGDAVIEEAELVQIKLMVDVKGEVRLPGLYELEEGQRVLDAIEAAGGLTENANVKSLNYAQICTDEMVVYVPSHDEEDVIPTFTQTNQGQVGHSVSSGKINVNTALEEELTKLSGIGPSKAAAIMKYREEHGHFKSPEELTNVPGIGEKTLEKFIDQIITP